MARGHQKRWGERSREKVRGWTQYHKKIQELGDQEKKGHKNWQTDMIFRPGILYTGILNQSKTNRWVSISKDC